MHAFCYTLHSLFYFLFLIFYFTMATTLTLRRRIRTAQNVSKTTKAMQMIAASKLKKAQEAALASRPYVEHLTTLTQGLAPKDPTQTESLHPYLRPPITSNLKPKTLYIIISPDKGLCGGLITNLVREYFKLRNDESALFLTVGKKIEGPVASSNQHLIASFPFGLNVPAFDAIYPIAEIIDEYFLGGKVSKVKIITTHFNSVFSQQPKIFDLLPILLPQTESRELKTENRIFEPPAAELLPPLVKRYLQMSLYQFLLESYASEQAARMLAMQNATNNAKDIVNALKLLYNKARQEKITSEILDISSASVALEAEE